MSVRIALVAVGADQLDPVLLKIHFYVKALESDFVSHQAMHTSLKRDRKVSLPDDGDNRRKRKLESIKNCRVVSRL